MLSRPALRKPPRFAGLAGLVTAGLVVVASIAGLTWRAIYARETLSWRTQGMAQDWVDLLIAAPWLAIAAALTLRGSRRGALLLGGGLAYTAYSFAIYAFAMHFNALFLVYVAILGLSIHGLADLVRVLGHERFAGWFDDRAPRALAATAMMVLAGLFALLWLAQILPAIARGVDPPELAEVGLITNPVHVLDLAIVLPLLFVAGLLLKRRRDAGYFLGTVLLGFSVLMDLALLAMMVAMRREGLPAGDAVLGGFVVLTLGFVALLAGMLRAVRGR
jgi:hypothetical protein